MNQFYNQMFNPTYVNQSFYQSIPSQTMWQYQQDQNAEVQKAVKATRDLCEATIAAAINMAANFFFILFSPFQ